MGPSLADLIASTPLSGGNAAYVESVYERYLEDRDSVDAQWRELFDALPPGAQADVAHAGIVEQLAQRMRAPVAAHAVPAGSHAESEKQGAVSRHSPISRRSAA